MAMVYSGTRVPGGHYNPALTIAMLIRHRLAPRAALAFWLVQFGAGLLAAVSVRAIVDPRQLAVTAAMTLKGPTLVAAFALELVLTCVLCCVALEVSTRNSHPVDDYYAWPIAFSVIAGVVVIGAITNGAFDPAVSFDDALLGIFSADALGLPGVATALWNRRHDHIREPRRPPLSDAGVQSAIHRRATELLLVEHASSRMCRRWLG